MSARAARRATIRSFHHLVLAPHHHAAAVDQIGKIDAMGGPAEAQHDAVMNQPLPAHAGSDAGLLKQSGRSVFENAGTRPTFHGSLGSGFENDRLDPFLLEQVRQEKSGRPRSHDPDLRPHGTALVSTSRSEGKA
jgi:hypothetical protein